MSKGTVLAIGLKPETLDFEGEFLKGKPVDARSIAAGIAADEERARALGYDFEWLLLDASAGREAGASAVREALQARPVQVIVIGGGVRLDPAQTEMLEALVNAVQASAPAARIAFNTNPQDTVDAIRRWI